MENGNRRPIARASDRAVCVTYWTGWLSPEMEGCSKEVFALKNHFRRSCVIGLSRFYEMKVSLRERCYGMNFRWYPLFRLLAPFCERRSKINHIYGSLAEWFFLHTLRQRPIVITIASPDAPLARPMYRRVRRFVAQSNPTVAELRGWGFDPETVRLIYPGIDLNRYHPAPRAPGRKFRVLFATSPNSDEGFVNRGVALMLEAAARLPDVEFHLLWRPWGDDPTAQRLEGKEAPNVIVSRNVIGNMTDVFHAADATIAPFVRNHDSKICPTSLLESLACGRPALVSTKVAVADVIRDEQCGEVFEPTVEGLCEAIESLRRRYEACAGNARAVAERHFDLRHCLRQYEILYQEMLTNDRE